MKDKVRFRPHTELSTQAVARTCRLSLWWCPAPSHSDLLCMWSPGQVLCWWQSQTHSSWVLLPLLPIHPWLPPGLVASRPGTPCWAGKSFSLPSPRTSAGLPDCPSGPNAQLLDSHRGTTVFYVPAPSPNTQYEMCFLNSLTECFLQG